MVKRNFPSSLLIIIAVGFVLRIYHLDTVPLRGDEAFTIQNWMSLPLMESLSDIATIEPHPFLNYVLFHVWGLLAGTSAFSARYLPALINTFGISVVYALGKHLFDRRVAIVSALFWAIHPFLIWHSQDARNYAVWSALSALALWLGFRALQSNRRMDWWLYLIAALLSTNIFYFEWFTLIAFTFYGILSCWKNWSRLMQLVVVQIVILFFTLLSFVILQGNLVASGGYGGTTGAGLNIPELFTSFLPALLWGETLPDLLSTLLTVAAVAMLVIAVLSVYRFRQSHCLFLVTIGFLPLFLLGAISLRFDVFDPKYVLSVVPAFVLLQAFLVVSLFSFRLPLGVVAVVFWISIVSFSLYNLFFVSDYTKSKNWPDVTTYLEKNVSANDLVIQLSVDPAFGYYYQGLARDIGLPARPDQSTTDIVQELEIASSHYQSLWLVGQTFPDWPNYGVVEKWLRDNMQAVRSTNISDLQVQQYMRWEVNQTTAKPLAVFTQVVELTDAQVWLPPEPNDEITIWLYWRPLSNTGEPYKVFVHLQGAINPATGTPLWSQDDRYPQNGTINTTDWTPRVTYRDIYVLPLGDIPAGEYDVRIGLYNPTTGERLLLESGEDSYLLQTIKLL